MSGSGTQVCHLSTWSLCSGGGTYRCQKVTGLLPPQEKAVLTETRGGVGQAWALVWTVRMLRDLVWLEEEEDPVWL